MTRVMLVENEIVSAKSLEKMLLKLGYDIVSVVKSGEDVLEYVNNIHPDIILMDIELEGKIDGIEATAQVQAEVDIPVIYITSFDDELTLQRALITSPYNYLSKPVSDKMLGNAIEIAIHRHKIEKSFKERDKWLEIISNIIDEAILITDKNGVIIYMNPKAEELTGWDNEEALGNVYSDILDIKTDYTDKPGENLLDSVLQYNFSVNLPEKSYLISRAGNQLFISGKAFPVKDDGGATNGVAFMVKEIKDKIIDIRDKKGDLEKKFIERTVELMEEKIERERVEESLHTSEEKYKKIVETTLEGIWLADNSHKTTFVNNKIADLLGFSTEELLKTSLSDHLEISYRNSFLKDFENKSNISGRISEFLFNRKNGSDLWALVSTNILYDDSNKPIGFLSMISDITERKRAEKEIIDAKLKAEESSKLKSFLILNLNHELRTPMNGILGFTGLLKDEISNKEHSDMLNHVYDSGTRLMSTLNSIMEFATLESGNTVIDIKDYNLHDNIHRLFGEYKGRAEAKGLKYSINIADEKTTVKTDIEMLKSLISKILDNAIKYTKKGSIYSTIKETGHNEELYAEIKISDTGIGIPDGKQKIIFEEFKQVSEGYGRAHEGVGLGLSIAKRIAEMLNVNLTFASSPKNGTTFTIRIPAVRKETHKQAVEKPLKKIVSDEIPPDTENLKKQKSVLIVEDNITNINLMIVFLKNIYEINYALDGEKAVELAKKEKFSIILTDINLGPGIDGIETQKQIRKIEGYKNIPNLAVTGYSSPNDKEMLLKEGFDSVVPKPYTKLSLIKAIEYSLRRVSE